MRNPRRESAPARESEGPPQSPANLHLYQRKRNRMNPPTQSSSDPFAYPRMTQRDRIREARQLERARTARREQLADLGLYERDRSHDLALARGVAAVDRIRPPTRAEDDAFRAMLQRVAERAVRRLETRATPEYPERLGTRWSGAA